MNKLSSSILIILISLGVGFFAGYLNFSTSLSNRCFSDLKMINPDLDCEIYNQKTQNLSSLQANLEKAISGFTNKGDALRIGVFVRDLTSQKFVGVNDGDVFNMASLLKVPLMIGGFKLAEVEPKILDQQIKYTGKPDLYNEQFIQPEKKLEVGKSYSIKDLIERSVIYSDNTASQLLFDYYPDEFMDRILTALGMQLRSRGGDSENPATARSYAGIFRILYNASYLTREYSNDSLSILSNSTFKDGAVSRLPKDVVVAHKFAERTTTTSKTTRGLPIRQMHDCGIVYLADATEPYSFCIMTEGEDFLKLENVIQDISLLIYQGMATN